MMRLALAALTIIALATPLRAAGRPMTADDLLAIKGVSDPQVSPDGLWVVYVVSELDRATEKTNSDLWVVAVAGGEPRRMTNIHGGGASTRRRPAGRHVS